MGIRKVAKTIRNSMWKQIIRRIEEWKLEKLFYIHNTEMYLRCKVNGNEFLTIGMDDPEKLKSIVSPSFAWLLESTELTEADYDQIVTRFRGYTDHYTQIMCDFNPIDEYHWIKTRYFPDEIEQKVLKERFVRVTEEVALKDNVKVPIHILLVHSDHWDNKFLSDKDHARYEHFKKTNPAHYKVYGLGHWGSTEGLVYPSGYVIIPREKYPEEYDEIIYGLDFGYVHPTSLTRYYLKRVEEEHGSILESYTEELIFEKGLEIAQLIEMMKSFNIHPADPIYADYQAAEKISQLQNYQENDQYLFNVILADKSVKDGIEYLRTVRRYSCPENINHNRQIKSYRYNIDTKRSALAGKPVYDDEKPIKFDDDAMDNERYALFTHSKLIEVKLAFIEREK